MEKKNTEIPALRVRDLEISYREGAETRNAVCGITMDIYAGEVTVVLGPSGCGKTSTLNALGGMLTPTGGKIFWNTQNVARMNDRERSEYRRNAVGFVFQQYNLIHDLTVEENVRIAGAMAEDPRSVQEVLEMVGLTGREKSRPAQMSGGEQQRVCIARALVKRAGLLLCDEPTGALDTENTRTVLGILQDLAKNHRVPVVMITHNPQFVRIADHCIRMRDGRIVEDRRQTPIAVADLELD